MNNEIFELLPEYSLRENKKELDTIISGWSTEYYNRIHDTQLSTYSNCFIWTATLTSRMSYKIYIFPQSHDLLLQYALEDEYGRDVVFSMDYCKHIQELYNNFKKFIYDIIK